MVIVKIIYKIKNIHEKLVKTKIETYYNNLLKNFQEEIKSYLSVKFNYIPYFVLLPFATFLGLGKRLVALTPFFNALLNKGFKEGVATIRDMDPSLFINKVGKEN